MLQDAKSVTNSVSSAVRGLLGIQQAAEKVLTPEPKRPEAVVLTAQEAKASRHLVRLHGEGNITLTPEQLDRHEDVVIADEIRRSDNRQNNRMHRHFANPANRPKDSHKTSYGKSAWNGKFGDDMPMNDYRRTPQYQRMADGSIGSTGVARPYQEDEDRTPNEIKASK